jgi:hypothetical protein
MMKAHQKVKRWEDNLQPTKEQTNKPRKDAKALQ